MTLSACITPEPVRTATLEPTATAFPTNPSESSPTSEPTSMTDPDPTPEPTDIPEPTAEPQLKREEGRHYEEEEKFSYIPIEGWALYDFPGLTTKVLMATDAENLGVNLVFVPEIYDGSTEEFAKLGIAGAKVLMEEFVEGEYSFFETDSGLTVVRILARYKSQGIEVDGIFYLVGDDKGQSNLKLTITFTRFANSANKMEAQVEALIRSIQFED